VQICASDSALHSLFGNRSRNIEFLNAAISAGPWPLRTRLAFSLNILSRH